MYKTTICYPSNKTTAQHVSIQLSAKWSVPSNVTQHIEYVIYKHLSLTQRHMSVHDMMCSINNYMQKIVKIFEDI